MKKTVITFPVILLLVLAMSLYCGCATGPGGKLVRGSSGVTFTQLVENWQDYNIYWYGTDYSWVRGILFDPKDDDLVLTGEKWTKVNDEETLNKMLTQDLNIRQRRIRFYQVFGPEDQLFGYLVITRDHPTPGTELIDEKTLNVYLITPAARDMSW